MPQKQWIVESRGRTTPTAAPVPAPTAAESGALALGPTTIQPDSLWQQLGRSTLNAIPAAGGTLGGLLGFTAAGPGGAIVGAGTGGMGGEALRQSLADILYNRTPSLTPADASSNILKEGLTNALAEMFGFGMGAVGNKLLQSSTGHYARALDPSGNASKVYAEEAAQAMAQQGYRPGTARGLQDRATARAKQVGGNINDEIYRMEQAAAQRGQAVGPQPMPQIAAANAPPTTFATTASDLTASPHVEQWPTAAELYGPSTPTVARQLEMPIPIPNEVRGPLPSGQVPTQSITQQNTALAVGNQSRGTPLLQDITPFGVDTPTTTIAHPGPAPVETVHQGTLWSPGEVSTSPVMGMAQSPMRMQSPPPAQTPSQAAMWVPGATPVAGPAEAAPTAEFTARLAEKNIDAAAIRDSLTKIRDSGLLTNTRGIVGNPNKVKNVQAQLDKLDEIVAQQGRFLSPATAISWRRNLDEMVKHASEGFTKDLADASLAEANKVTGNVIRREINTKYPNLAELNATFHLENTISDLMRAREIRKIGSSDSFNKSFMAARLALGGTGGYVAGGNDIWTGIAGAVGVEAAAHLVAYMQSPLWQSTSGYMRSRLSKALTNRKGQEITKMILRAAKAPSTATPPVQQSQATPQDVPDIQAVTPPRTLQDMLSR